jgi:rubrerythrin
MNIFKLLQEFAPAWEQTVANTSLTSRRDVFRFLAKSGQQVLAKAVPLAAVGVASGRAAVAAPQADGILDVLNFALLLEYLEDDFYRQGLEKADIPMGGRDRAIFTVLGKHEAAHVVFLRAAISGSGGMPIDFPSNGFDFTAGGLLPDPFANGNYEVFMALAQAFEDTGVRAYKGQAANLMASNAVLTAALQIHSVEARHASEVRRLRGLRGWITQAERGMGMPEATQAVYMGEDNVTQAGINVNTVTDVGIDAVTESFDEPLTKEEVTAIASLFIPA